jgi:hypothetical protein
VNEADVLVVDGQQPLGSTVETVNAWYLSGQG